MTNKPYQDDNHNTEYKLMDEHGADGQYVADAPPELTPGKLNKIKGKFKPVYVVAVVCILAIIGFIYKSVRHPAVVPPHITQIAPVAQPIETTLVPKNDQEKQAIATITQLEQMQAQTQQNLNKIEQSVADLNQRVEDLALSTQSLSQTVATKLVEKTQIEKNEKAMVDQQNAEIRKQKQYYVTAVIPGRAWLASRDGETLTVAGGDYLHGYGKVKSIDPYSGDVVTDSGAVIQYAASEK